MFALDHRDGAIIKTLKKTDKVSFLNFFSGSPCVQRNRRYVSRGQSMYKVLAATRVDMNEGWVWLTNKEFPPRSVIKVTNKTNNKSIYCEALEIDENFIKEYNQPPRIDIDANEDTIVINGWYRSRLGKIVTKQKHDLHVEKSNSLKGKLMATIGHPQVVVRLATWLAVISVGLGLVSMILAFK